MNTNVITIPRTLALRDDLIVLPRKEYEFLLASRQKVENVDMAIGAGLQEYENGKFSGPFTLDGARTFLRKRVVK